jgi:PBP1b-binding outer membrane lipoprotein LpoB
MKRLMILVALCALMVAGCMKAKESSKKETESTSKPAATQTGEKPAQPAVPVKKP